VRELNERPLVAGVTDSKETQQGEAFRAVREASTRELCGYFCFLHRRIPVKSLLVLVAFTLALAALPSSASAQGWGRPPMYRPPVPQVPRGYYYPGSRITPVPYGYGYYRGPAQYNFSRPNVRGGVTVWPNGRGNVRIQTRGGGFSFRF